MQRFSVAMTAGLMLVLLLGSCKGERDLFVTLDPDAPTTQMPTRQAGES